MKLSSNNSVFAIWITGNYDDLDDWLATIQQLLNLAKTIEIKQRNRSANDTTQQPQTKHNFSQLMEVFKMSLPGQKAYQKKIPADQLRIEH